MVKIRKTLKGRYTPISIPLLDKKELNDDTIRSIRQIQRQAIDNFIAHKGVELIPFGKSGNPETIKKGWGFKKKQTDE